MEQAAGVSRGNIRERALCSYISTIQRSPCDTHACVSGKFIAFNRDERDSHPLTRHVEYDDNKDAEKSGAEDAKGVRVEHETP